MVTEPQQDTRAPLSRDRVLAAAIEVADEGGLEALTMRGLAETLDVEAMSLYYHVANKEALLDGVAEKVVQEVLEEVSSIDTDATPETWKETMRTVILGARRVMLRHKWAPVVLETRTTMVPPVIVYFHGLLEVFKSGGMSMDLAHHGLHALGSRALGFSQEMFNPAPGSDAEEQNEEMFAQMLSELPLFVEFMQEIAHDDPEDETLGWCDDQTEFEFSLDLMLDGLDRLRLVEGSA